MWRQHVMTLLAVLGTARAQFQLIWATGPDTPPTTLGPGGFNPNCVDKVDNCKAYGEGSCKAPYDVWAKKNCANYCGFCIGPTTPPPACRDAVDDCDEYSKSVCTDPEFKTWVEDNCRYYCRKCPPAQLANLDAHTTTPSPADCVDKVDCRLYGQKTCTDSSYAKWTRTNCPAYCKLCVGVATPAPACVDKIPDCSGYAKSCSDPQFTMWVEDNCRKTCGKCGTAGGAVNYPVPAQPGKRLSN